MKFSQVIISLLLAILVFGLFSYKLLDVPPGINGDEAAIGYNSALIARTLKDENNRFLPVFILSYGHDWHQPYTVYFNAVLFSIFSPSFLILRISSVLIMVISTLLLYYLLFKMRGKMFAYFGVLIFITTPILMFQSHLGMENIMSIPFILLWLIGIYFYQTQKKIWYLIMAAIFLGASFYSYKGMRLMVPVWTILSCFYILWVCRRVHNLKWQNTFKSLGLFIIFILPFFLIAPILETKYAGAVFDRKGLGLIPYYEFFYGYLGNLDPSFLFIKGDDLILHSTGRHGMILLFSLPFFLLGVMRAIKYKGFLLFCLLIFLLGPLLFGLADSVHRASRLLALIPSYTIICSFGVLETFRYKFFNLGRINLFGILLVIFLTFNYADFLNYYWNYYPERYKEDENFKVSSHDSYKALAKVSKEMNLKPVIDADIYNNEGYAAKFYTAAYLPEDIEIWKNTSPVPSNSVILTDIEQLNGSKRLDMEIYKYKLLVPNNLE